MLEGMKNKGCLSVRKQTYARASPKYRRHACLPSVPPAAPSLAGGTLVVRLPCISPRRLGYDGLALYDVMKGISCPTAG